MFDRASVYSGYLQRQRESVIRSLTDTRHQTKAMCSALNLNEMPLTFG